VFQYLHWRYRFGSQGAPASTLPAMPEIGRREAQQDSYMAQSKPVRPDEVEAWSWQRRLWNNSIAVLGPVL
jgi:hypothetical protein